MITAQKTGWNFAEKKNRRSKVVIDRDMVRAATAEYLANGGKITVVEADDCDGYMKIRYAGQADNFLIEC